MKFRTVDRSYYDEDLSEEEFNQIRFTEEIERLGRKMSKLPLYGDVASSEQRFDRY